MQRLHIVGISAGQWGEAFVQGSRPEVRDVIDGDVVRIGRAHDAVVRRYDVARFRVAHPRHVFERHHPAPLMLARPAGNGSPCVRTRPDRQPAAHEVADVPSNVGAEQVVAGVNPIALGGLELVGVRHREHGEDAIGPAPRLGGRGIPQGHRVAGSRLSENHRAVMRPHHLDLRVGCSSRPQRLAAHVGRTPLALVLVPGRCVRAEPLDEQILIVGGGVRDAPRHPAVMPEMVESRQPRERQPDCVEIGARYPVLVVDVRGIRRTVGVSGEQRAARARTGG